MGMRKFSRCPRCGGNMFLERDLDSLYEECLQCSCRREVMKITRRVSSHLAGIEAEPVREEKVKVLSPLGR